MARAPSVPLSQKSQSLTLSSHWPEMGHMATPAAREAGKTPGTGWHGFSQLMVPTTRDSYSLFSSCFSVSPNFSAIDKYYIYSKCNIYLFIIIF